MNVNLWLRETKNRIDALDAELILLKVLREKDRSFLIAHDRMPLMSNDLDVLEKMVQLRERHAPLAYITGKKEFYGRDFFVDRNVLIPRGESEDIIDIVKELKPKKVLDVGTGSGCLAISISLEMPKTEVVAVDCSKEALSVAMDNALEMDARVTFLKSDLLERVKDEKFDVMVANLPYVDRDWDFLSPELEWEPKDALFAEDGGLEVIFRFIDEVVKYKKTKYVVIESDVCQHEKVRFYAGKKGLAVACELGYQQVFKF